MSETADRNTRPPTQDEESLDRLLEALEENTGAMAMLLNALGHKAPGATSDGNEAVNEIMAMSRGSTKMYQNRLEQIRPEGHLTISEAATRCDMSESGLRIRVQRGLLPAIEKHLWGKTGQGDKVYFIKEEDLTAQYVPRLSGKPTHRGIKPTPEGMISIKEAASMLNKSDDTVRRRIRDGYLPGEKQPNPAQGGYRYVIPREAVEELARLEGKPRVPVGKPRASVKAPSEAPSESASKPNVRRTPRKEETDQEAPVQTTRGQSWFRRLFS